MRSIFMSLSSFIYSLMFPNYSFLSPADLYDQINKKKSGCSNNVRNARK